MPSTPSSLFATDRPSPGKVSAFGASFKATLPLWLALIAFAAGLWPQALMNDSDTLWHLSAGQYMMDHKVILSTDPFSFSYFGKPWHTHEWLSEIVMSWVYQAAGWPGLMTVSAACMGLTTLIAARFSARYLSGLALILMVLIGLSLIGPHYLIRPHLFTLPLLAGLTAAILSAREANTRPPLMLAGLFLLWANMHASFIFGLGLIGFFGIEAIISAPKPLRFKALGEWTALLALSVAACLITPQGVDGFVFPFKLIFMPGIEGIAEWAPADITGISPLLVALMAGVYVLVRFRLKLSLWRAALLAVLVLLSLGHIRYEMILGLMGLFVLSEPLSRALEAPAPERTAFKPKDWTMPVIAGMLVLALRLSLPAPPPTTLNHPTEALKVVPAALRTQPLLHDYDFGGFLIAEGVRPFVDGRADMYGADFLKAYDAIMAASPEALSRALDANAMQWTLLKAQNPAVSALDRLPGWRRLYADPQVVVHVRKTPLGHARHGLAPLEPLR